MAKWDNMLAIVWLLRSRNSMTAEQLSERLEISVRTVYRYIDALCASGVPIVADPGHDGGYHLPKSFREAPLFFNLNELKSLFHAASFARGAGYPYEKDLSHALEKIQQNLNYKQKAYLDRHMSGLDVMFSQHDELMHRWLKQLEQTVAEGQTIDMFYDKRKGEGPVERRIDPYGLVYRQNYWYVVAFCHLRQELRTFRIDRISYLSYSGLFFERPSDFSASKYLQNQWSFEWEAKEPATMIHVRGIPEVMDYLCQNMHHCLMERGDEEAHFKINVERMENKLPAFLLSFGTGIQVLEPQALRNKMAEKARQLANYYETNEYLDGVER
ncbi:helix-turn-helix transcriptional regulator [Virgibacillus salinus]|uniref:Predicted DNA-binding transcriptional regulator YafY, contains an HTH and WYL domains n=1 Tax=Virgibacillus salinus TaxID=553311 RepID=A0A1H1EUS5_9BACI|nr:YafY family protein [Virgibacillus salinus]SDQ92517.1 Predicted DNA-binding transcriptional regulator YafY, contains an HTH and WYL domains [Virgibacillus salinus]